MNYTLRPLESLNESPTALNGRYTGLYPLGVALRRLWLNALH